MNNNIEQNQLSSNISRNEISDAIFNEFGLSKSECNNFVSQIINLLINSLIKDGFVKIPGFGTFRLRYKKTLSGRNPKTKEPAEISSRYVILFKVSQQLKNRLNDN